MHSKLIVFLFCTCWIILANGPQHVEGNFVDDIKAFVRGESAEQKRARMLKQLGEQIVDDVKDVVKSPEAFYDEIVEPILNYTPIVGHLKWAIHQKMGNDKKAEETWYEANTVPRFIVDVGIDIFKIIKNLFN